jgi:hypothetical protein
MKYENREVVLKALVGSHNYNLNTPESDKDYKYFVAPTFEDLYYGKMFSTAKQTDTLDYDVHDIRQLGNLLWKANINFIEVLFSTNYEYINPDLEFLIIKREKFASMNLPAFYNATMGMHRQKMGELFKGTEKTKCLIEKFGYDTKQACHALRCLFVLEKYNLNGGLMGNALWFNTDDIRGKCLLDVKAGNWSLEIFKEFVGNYEGNIERWKSWYHAVSPDEALKNELDDKIMRFVKGKLFDDTKADSADSGR